MLKDVSSLANAYGGYIIIGIEEDEDHCPKRIYNVENAPNVVESIQQSCLSAIAPRIPGLKVRVIPHPSGDSSIIIFIPASIRKPHMVTHSGMNQFWIRHYKGIAAMSTEEIRDACLNTVNIWKSVDEFIKNRESEVVRELSDESALLMGACPIQTNEDIIDIKNPIFRDFIREPPHLTREKYISFKRRPIIPEPTLRGLRITDRTRANIELYSNGYYEMQIVTSTLVKGMEGQKLINNIIVSCFFVEFFRSLSYLVNYLGLEYPYVVYADFLNLVSGLGFHEDPGAMLGAGSVVWNKCELKLPPRQIIDITQPDKEAKKYLDKLWNAFGSDENPFFEDGEFTDPS